MWRDLGVAGSLMRCCRPIVGMMSLWDTVAYGANSHSVALGIVYGDAKGPIADERGLIWWCQSQCCGVGVETGVGVCRSRPVWLESEWELESVKFGRLRSGPESQTYTWQQRMILEERLRNPRNH